MKPVPRAFGMALAASIVLVAGCATTPPRATNEASLTYETSPAGAHLFEGGQDLGEAPVTRTYRAEAGNQRITTPDVTAVWPSGAKTTYFTYIDVGADLVATLVRPADAAGREADEANAKKVEARRKAEGQSGHMSARCQAQVAAGGSSIADCQ